MRPEFIALKYVGVPTVAELEKDATSYGWKCRKYSRWRKIHIESGDAKVLHKMANSLIDEGKVCCESYGRISEIWLRVQRWRLDKDNLLIEPPQKDTWERLNVGVKVANKYPRAIVSFLFSKGIEVELNSSFASLLFILPFVIEFKNDTGLDLPEKLSKNYFSLTTSEVDLWSDFSSFIHQMYVGQCAYLENSINGLNLINNILDDLDIDSFLCPDFLPYSESTLVDEPDVIVEYSTMPKDKALNVKLIKGKTIVVLNEEHLGLQNLMKLSGHNASELLFAAIGLTANNMSTKEKVICDFLALLSLNLTKLSQDGFMTDCQE